MHSVLQTLLKTCKLHKCYCAKVLIWTIAACPASTLQLAPAFFIKSFFGVRLTQVYKHLFHGLLIRLCLDLLLPSETIAEPAQTVTLQGCSERKRPQLVSRLLRNLGIFVTTVSCQFCLLCLCFCLYVFLRLCFCFCVFLSVLFCDLSFLCPFVFVLVLFSCSSQFPIWKGALPSNAEHLGGSRECQNSQISPPKISSPPDLFISL